MAKRPRRPVWPSFTAGRHLRPSRYWIWINFPAGGTWARKRPTRPRKVIVPPRRRLRGSSRRLAQPRTSRRDDFGRRPQRAGAGEANAHLARDAARQPDGVAPVPVGDDLGERAPLAARQPARFDRDASVRQQRPARPQHAAEPRALAVSDPDRAPRRRARLRRGARGWRRAGVGAQRQVHDHLLSVRALGGDAACRRRPSRWPAARTCRARAGRRGRRRRGRCPRGASRASRHSATPRRRISICPPATPLCSSEVCDPDLGRALCSLAKAREGAVVSRRSLAVANACPWSAFPAASSSQTYSGPIAVARHARGRRVPREPCPADARAHPSASSGADPIL